MIRSLAPVWDRHARVLILGSMPGAESLRRQRYYAHPRNAFWPLMGALLGAGPELDYAERLAWLRRHGVALWDVLESCERQGSLDSDIRRGSERPNALVELLERLEAPRAILLNGRKAQLSFERFVGARVRARWPQLAVLAMPSTSPAHAGLRLLDKQAIWSRMLAFLEPPRKEAVAMAKTPRPAAKKKTTSTASTAAKRAAPARAPAKKTTVKATKKPATAGKPAKAQPAKTKTVKPAKPAVPARAPAAKKKPAAAPAAKPAASAPAVARPVPATSKPKTVAKPSAAKAPVSAPAPAAAVQPVPPKPAPAPAPTIPAAVPAKPEAVAPTTAAPARPDAQPDNLTVKPALFKQPLRKPQPWHFGGRPTQGHGFDHGVKAQPDAERLAGKSRKVH